MEWVKAWNGTTKILGGLADLGVRGETHVLIQPEDGAAIEAVLGNQATFKTRDFRNEDGVIIREWRRENVLFRWPTNLE